MNDYGMVIIGAGEAGARAAEALREQGWAGKMTLIGNEGRLPYERPPLSKEQLTGEGQTRPVSVLSDERMEGYGIRFLSGDAAMAIDRDKRVVRLASGAEVGYGRLLLATGSQPRRLSVEGDASDDVLYLRKYDDALALRKRLLPGKRLAIIGGGFIGLEVAASAIALGCEATLVEAAPRILMRGVPEPIAAQAEARHREAGVAFKLGVGIDSANREDDGYVIRLADGSAIRCDAIVAGIGAIPETALAAASGLDIENGIKVNGQLQTSDPDIYAIGDCCSFPHPLYGGRRIRLEAWRNARDQGAHVAANLLGAANEYASVPWFWSDQYDWTLQVAGLADPSNELVLRDMGAAGRIYFHLAEDGRLAAASGIGPAGGAIAREMRLAEMLVEQRASPAREQLSDPSAKLKALLRG
ncbi:NAD(P)/FAD-dependent oxidoreductase [Cohnella hongkongensis]|uniref:NAD(P)/FAD-dependent oxidoreductase n=1 Tax=Cohnella hongkongensis TaxID=178337 RepID=A0ABV9F822_9BACL